VQLTDLTHLSPAEAHQKVAYVQFKIWYEQYKENFFVKDPRPEYYLRNELRAYWAGHITEFHGWTNPIGQVADWVIEKVDETLRWLWDNIMKPGIEAIVSGFTGIWNTIKSKAEDVWNKVVDIYNKAVDIFNYVTQTIYQKLLDAWNWLKDIGSTIYSKASEAIQIVQTWLTEKATEIVSSISAVVQGIISSVSEVVNTVWTNISAALGTVQTVITNAWNSLTEFISGKLETITKALSALPQSIAAGFQSAVSFLYDILKNVWDKVIVPVGEKVKGALEWIAERLQDVFWQ